MLAQAILHTSITLALISPLFVALAICASFFAKNSQENFERLTYRLVRFSSTFMLSASVVGLISFGFAQMPYDVINYAQIHLIKGFLIPLRISFDLLSLIFLVTCHLIAAIITFFSHRYLHRDPGYRRFFITISLFVFGLNLIVLADSFDLIFAGWEIVGLSSFLLIGYFWHRPKAIQAACRTYYIYRITDLGLLISLLITHFIWHDLNIFRDFLSGDFSQALLQISTPWRWLLSVSILLPVLGKAAQFPFCFWLPKAMEGPTHSSAIFYGSLSIHVGIFLLLRTMPIWNHTPGFNYLLAGIGILTAISSTLFALVQSNIKGQIGYASIAQVGIMLIELALGFETLAFIHMIGNAFLRCFQLLVSSSILTTHLQMQTVVRSFGELRAFSLPQFFPKSFRASLYVFAINDGYFETILKKLFATPMNYLALFANAILTGSLNNLTRVRFKSMRQMMSSNETSLSAFSPMFVFLILGVIFDIVFRANEYIGIFSLLVALFLALGALGEQKHPQRALLFVIFGNLFAFLSMVLFKPGWIHVIGLLIASVIAVESLRYITTRRTVKDLKNYLGLYQQFPLAGTVFLVGLLGIASFPISSTFFGEDILLNLSLGSGLHYLLILQLIFILSGIALIRLYAIVMLGKRDNFVKDINLDMGRAAAFMRISFFVLGNVAAFLFVKLPDFVF